MESANGSEWKPKERGQNNNQSWNDGSVGPTQNTNKDGWRGDERQEESEVGEQRNISAGDNERLSTNDGEVGITADTDSTSNKARSQREVLGQSDRQKANGHCDVECRNKWQNFPTKPPICGGNDGIPRKLDSITFSKWRNESIKAYGNAIVPQVAFEIFKAINEYESI